VLPGLEEGKWLYSCMNSASSHYIHGASPN
jgi:hypothetical protein